MDPVLNGLQIAILVTDGFEQVEFTEPKYALEQEGAVTKVISDKHGMVQGVHHGTPADQFEIDLQINEADAKSFNAVLLPGGAENASRLREIPEAQEFVRRIQADSKPIAVICHGAWLLVSADLVKGRTLTSSPDLEQDIRKAGGNWIDQEVVVDGNLVSSRKPDDLPAFIPQMVKVIQENMQANLQGTPDEHAVGIASS